MREGRIDEAIQLCEEGIRRHPYYVTGHMVLGKCYLEKKLFDQAEKEFKRVLLFDPKYIAAHKHYADLMREIGWDNTCEMSYRKIQQIDPLDSAVQAVVEEFGRKAGREHAGPATKPPFTQAGPVIEPAPKKPPSPSVPVAEADIPSTSGFEEDEFLRYQPVPVDTGEMATPESETTQMPEYAAAPLESSGTLPPSDEERYSYILDDIFQDEVLKEKPAPSTPPKKEIFPEVHLRPDDETIFPDVSPFDEHFGPDQGVAAPEPTDSSTDDEERISYQKPLPPSANDFDYASGEAETLPRQQSRPPSKTNSGFGEAPPAGFDSSGIGLPSQSTEADKGKAERNRADLPLVLQSGRRGSVVKTPARRTKVFDELKEVEESASPPPSGEREKIVTPTLGEIYAAQGQYAKAIGVFELLSKKDPNNRHYRDKIEYLKKRLLETQNAG
jgi:tetratricopeptide (TPR) repeat protein